MSNKEKPAKSAPFSKSDYKQLCKYWAMCDHWPLDDAINLLLELPTKSYGESNIDSEALRKRGFVRELALNCLGVSLPYTLLHDIDNEIHVGPNDFIEWAKSRRLPIPSELIESIQNYKKYLRNDAPSMRMNQRHRERCRAIAQYLWLFDSDITKHDMAARQELQRVGCEGKVYQNATIEDWIKDLNPNRNPGRRKSISK